MFERAQLAHAGEGDVLRLRDGQHDLGAEAVGEGVIHIDLGDHLVVHSDGILREVDPEGGECIGLVHGLKVGGPEADRPGTGGLDSRGGEHQQGAAGEETER